MRVYTSFAIVAVICAAFCMPAVSSASIILGQVDDFEDGTLMNWGGGASRSNQLGGPDGPADRYLQVTSSGGSGPGSRLATFNDSQWTGDYLAADVTGIQVDLRNFSNHELHMRLYLLFGAGGDFTSTDPVILAPNAGWQTVYFGLTASDLTGVDGGFDLDLTLANMPRLMIRHQDGEPGGVGVPPPIAATLGIDNFRAVPEPATLGLLAMGALMIRRRRR